MSSELFLQNSRNLLAVVGDFPFVEIQFSHFPWSRYHPNSNRIIQGISNIQMRYRSLHNSKILLFTSRSSVQAITICLFLSIFFLNFSLSVSESIKSQLIQVKPRATTSTFALGLDFSKTKVFLSLHFPSYNKHIDLVHFLKYWIQFIPFHTLVPYCDLILILHKTCSFLTVPDDFSNNNYSRRT
jgi:hypothetical protein